MYEMRVHKPSAYESQSAPARVPPGMPLPLTTYVPPDYVPPGTFIGFRLMPPMGETSDTASVPPRYSEYRMTQENFSKIVKA